MTTNGQYSIIRPKSQPLLHIYPPQLKIQLNKKWTSLHRKSISPADDHQNHHLTSSAGVFSISSIPNLLERPSKSYRPSLSHLWRGRGESGGHESLPRVTFYVGLFEICRKGRFFVHMGFCLCQMGWSFEISERALVLFGARCEEGWVEWRWDEVDRSDLIWHAGRVGNAVQCWCVREDGLGNFEAGST